jgi:hypothetical protein
MWEFPSYLAMPVLVAVVAFSAACVVYLILGALTVPKEIPPEESDDGN